VEVIEELLRAGMSVARFNFSHGSHEYHQVRGCGAGAGRTAAAARSGGSGARKRRGAAGA
jgi:hypothetical protein